MKLNVIFWVTFWAVATGCKPDHDAPCRDQVVKLTNDFTADDQKSMPYGANDSLVFVSATGDTLWMFNRLYQLSYTLQPTVVEGNPECPSDVDAFQMLEVLNMDTLSNIKIQGLWKKEGDSCWYVVANKKFGLNLSRVGNPDFSPYYDSLELNQKMFYGVSTVYGPSGDSILLTSGEGVIYFMEGLNAYRLESFKGR